MTPTHPVQKIYQVDRTLHGVVLYNSGEGYPKSTLFRSVSSQVSTRCSKYRFLIRYCQATLTGTGDGTGTRNGDGKLEEKYTPSPRRGQYYLIISQ